MTRETDPDHGGHATARDVEATAEVSDGAVRAVAAAEARYRQLLELVGAHVVTDAAGTVLEASEQAAELLATPQSLLIGRALPAFAAGPERANLRRTLTRARRDARRHVIELRLERPHGETFEAELAVAPFGDGAPEGRLNCLIRELSPGPHTKRELVEVTRELERRIGERTAELERSHDLLEARHALLETIVDRMPAGVIVADAPSGRITRLNDHAQRVLGALPLAHSVADYTIYSCFARDGSALEPEEWPLPRAVRGETVEHDVIDFVRADGTSVVLELSAAPVRDRRGRTVVAVCLFRDVTRREQQEQSAREFTTNAAHELRTPLAAIVSSVEVLQAGAKDVSDDRDRFLAHIEREADRLSRLTRSLLVLARAQRRTEAARVEVVDLQPLLADAAAGIRPAPGVEVEVEVERGFAALANADLTEQAVSNLAANAARYTERGRVTLTAWREGNEAVIAVADTGRGMTKAEIERAADRFFRGQARDRDGFGLGLSIARQAIETMGGRLVLESQHGGGTTATIHLPGATLVEG